MIDLYPLSKDTNFLAHSVLPALSPFQHWQAELNSELVPICAATLASNLSETR